MFALASDRAGVTTDALPVVDYESVVCDREHLCWNTLIGNMGGDSTYFLWVFYLAMLDKNEAVVVSGGI